MAETTTGRLIEMGQITTMDHDDGRHTYPLALLITFDSREAIRAAINAGQCKFSFGDDEPEQTLDAIAALRAKVANVGALAGLLLSRGYYPVAPECAGEGAQIINGQWHMPRWGCDTLQNVIDDHGDDCV